MKIFKKTVFPHKVLSLKGIREISRRGYVKYFGFGIVAIIAATIGTFYFSRLPDTSTSNELNFTSTLTRELTTGNELNFTSTLTRELTTGSLFVYEIKSDNNSYSITEKIVERDINQGYDCWKILRTYSNQGYQKEEVYWVDTVNGLLLVSIREEFYAEPIKKNIQWLDNQDLLILSYIEFIEYNYAENTARKKNIVFDENSRSYIHVETLDIEGTQYHIVPKSLTKGEFYYEGEVVDLEVIELALGTFLCYKIEDMPDQNTSRIRWYSVELGILVKQELWNPQEMSQQETVELLDMQITENRLTTSRIN